MHQSQSQNLYLPNKCKKLFFFNQMPHYQKDQEKLLLHQRKLKISTDVTYHLSTSEKIKWPNKEHINHFQEWLHGNETVQTAQAHLQKKHLTTGGCAGLCALGNTPNTCSLHRIIDYTNLEEASVEKTWHPLNLTYPVTNELKTLHFCSPFTKLL